MLYEPEYKSPISLKCDDIANTIIHKIQDETDEQIVYAASLATEIKIDADELKKALKYDREQYEKGYADGYKKGRAVAIDAILSVINTIKGTEANDNDELR